MKRNKTIKKSNSIFHFSQKIWIGIIIILGAIAALIIINNSHKSIYSAKEISADKLYISKVDWDAGNSIGGSLVQLFYPGRIEKAKEAIEAQVGKDFTDRYVHYDPAYTVITSEGTELSFFVTIPEKGVSYKTTTDPITVKVGFNWQGEIQNNPNTIRSLPKCSNVNECLSILDRGKAYKAALKLIEADGADSDYFILDWFGPYWRIRYYLSQKLTPDCKYKMGSTVDVAYDALNDTVVEKRVSCDSPGI